MDTAWQAVQVAVLVAATITAVVVISKAIVGVYRFVKRVELVHDTVMQELVPNGGTSIKDQISRIDRRLGEVEGVVLPHNRVPPPPT